MSSVYYLPLLILKIHAILLNLCLIIQAIPSSLPSLNSSYSFWNLEVGTSFVTVSTAVRYPLLLARENTCFPLARDARAALRTTTQA
ncbi:hypothetical protein [Capillibacterium thermochitinicola]|uniref:hypothetical protein n=1 Tax=Capillibacterium thermochitinicola TaxID=2699427 RepID=UPI001E317853|nr:hypothetical protein [Capillibacterium thermochitinicola]